MRLLFITTVAFVVQLYVAGGVNLPTLPGNKLLTDRDRFWPDAIVINCDGPMIHATYKTTNNVLNPSTALTQPKFQSNPFTSKPVVVNDPVLEVIGVGKFSFAEVQPQSGPKPDLVYGLQVDLTGRTGENAYWLPQGGFIDIPMVPDTSVTPVTKYVFTPDFSGCSWTITPNTTSGTLRLRHVEGDHEATQFNNLNEDIKGGPVTYAMQYRDYGYITKNGQRIDTIRAYAYMEFTNGRWEIHVQQQTCAPNPGNCYYDRYNLLDTMNMNYINQADYNMISGTLIFTVPNGR